jgi:hypothetical protein
MSQHSSNLAILYLKEKQGSPTHYRQMLLDGRTQGNAFLNALSDSERAALPWDKFHEVQRITTPEELNTFVNWLLDTTIKETNNG